MQQARGGAGAGIVADGAPLQVQRFRFGGQKIVGDLGGTGAHDPAGAGGELFDAAGQRYALRAGAEALRHRDVAAERRVHQETAGQGDVHRQRRTLGPDGVGLHLHQHRLAGAQQRANRRRLCAGTMGAGLRRVVVEDWTAHVGGRQQAGQAIPDIDEGAVQAGGDSLHPAQDDGAQQ